MTSHLLVARWCTTAVWKLDDSSPTCNLNLLPLQSDTPYPHRKCADPRSVKLKQNYTSHINFSYKLPNMRNDAVEMNNHTAKKCKKNVHNDSATTHSPPEIVDRAAVAKLELFRQSPWFFVKGNISCLWNGGYWSKAKVFKRRPNTLYWVNAICVW